MEIRRSGNLATTSQCANVATFQRCDFAMSRCLVNNSKSQRAAQRCDVNVASCDVAMFPRFLLQNYKKHGRTNFGFYRRTYGRERKTKQE